MGDPKFFGLERAFPTAVGGPKKMNLVFQTSPVTPHERDQFLNLKAFPSQEVFGDGKTYSQGIRKAMFYKHGIGT